MASVLGGLAGIAEKSGEQALAFGLGLALGASLEPAGVALAQEAWTIDPLRAPDAGTMAAGVAQGQVERDRAASWAEQHGYGAEAFAALVDVANTGPAIGQAMAAWRRGALTDGQFDTALQRAAIEPQWFAALRALKAERLDLGQIATGVHRGILRGEGLIVKTPPLTAGRVPFPAPSSIDPATEAEAHGIDAERLRVMVGNTGLPPGLMEMLRLLNMGQVDVADVQRAVAESNLRNEYMDVVLELRRRLLTPHEYQEAALRGIMPEAEADAGAALSGMEPADAKVLFETMGRPLSVRAMTTGLARGGRLGGTYNDVPEPYRDAIRRSNIRPEYADLAHANRYSLPGAFVLRTMAQSGELSKAQTETLLLETGWPPALAKAVASRWAAGGGSGGKEATKTELSDEYEGGYITEQEYRAALGTLGYADNELDLEVNLASARRLKRWREKIIDAIANGYLSFRLSDAQATSELAEANVTGEAATMLLRLWGMQRRDTVRTLTAAQIAKAFKKGLMTQAAALEALEEQGYSAEDAAILLQE